MRKGETKLWLASRSPGLERNGRVCNQARPAFTKASARILRQGEGWWRRRESNPRPETFHMGIYMFIPNFVCQPSGPFRARSPRTYPD